MDPSAPQQNQQNNQIPSQPLGVNSSNSALAGQTAIRAAAAAKDSKKTPFKQAKG